jgi:ankyrin repeat protein
MPSKSDEQFSDFGRAQMFFERIGYVRGSSKSGKLLDEDMMMRHILDCLGALIRVQSHKSTLGRSSKSKVFFAAVTAISSLTVDDIEANGDQSIIPSLVSSCFPGNTKTMGRFLGAKRDWMPALWTGILKDVKDVYSEDFSDETLDDIGDVKRCGMMKATPGHFAVAAKCPIMSVVRATIDSAAKAAVVDTIAGRTPLHYASLFSESVEVLEYLTTLNPEVVKIKDTINGRTPLHMLVEREYFEGQVLMVKCLTDAEPSILTATDNYGNTPLHISCHSQGKGRELIVSHLVRLNMNAVHETNIAGRIPLHLACETDDWSAVAVVRTLLSAYKDGARLIDEESGMIPLHFAAASSCARVVRMLLEAYPEGALMNVDYFGTAMHQTSCLTKDRRKVIHALHKENPMAVQTASMGNNWLPLHTTADLGNLESMMEIYHLYPDAVKAKDYDGNLPLHILMTDKDPCLYSFHPLSDEAGALRFLLKAYPQAVAVKNGGSYRGVVSSEVGETPYDISIRERLSPYVHRLLLRACPHIHREELHELNYAERRGALFLAFSAVCSEGTKGREAEVGQLQEEDRDSDQQTEAGRVVVADTLVSQLRRLANQGDKALLMAIISFL